ncbi:MAG: extensin family protein [Pseudomonadota bacterium]
MSAPVLLLAAVLGAAPETAPVPPSRRAPDAQDRSSGPERSVLPPIRPLPPWRPEPTVQTKPPTEDAPVQAPQLATAPQSTAIPKPGADLICRDPRLEGERIDPIRHATLPCGIAAPVKLHRVAGVRLSTPAKLTCGTARAVADWVTGILIPAARETMGSSPAELRVAGSYVCRTRNHQPGARISEHGLGRAIDFSAVSLADGRQVSVFADWGVGDAGRLLRRMHSGACGLFTTVLGPGSDAFHDDHFHFDTAARGGEPYCR